MVAEDPDSDEDVEVDCCFCDSVISVIPRQIFQMKRI